MNSERVDSIFTLASVFLTANRKWIVEFAAENRLPAMYHNEDFIEDGGLILYAPSLLDLYRRAVSNHERRTPSRCYSPLDRGGP